MTKKFDVVVERDSEGWYVASVPVHAGETLGHGLLSKILRGIELDRPQLLKLLGR